MKKVFLAVCAALASMSLFAQTEATPWCVGVYGGKVEAANDWGNKFFHVADGFYGAASFTVSRYLNKYFDAEAQVLWGRYGTQGGDFNATDPDFKAGMGYVDVSGKYKVIHSDTTLLNPFVFVSLGARAIYGLDADAADYQTTLPENEGFNFVLGGGAGVDFRITENWGFRYFFKYGCPLGSTADANDNRVCGKFNDQHLIHNLGVYFNFAFNKDKDGDGVPNKLDKCPNTLPEAVNFVDENGCDKDSDGDGVFDYLDKCPNTPAGIKVDEKGCPVDSDGDGVTDDIDLCPETPAEARGYVDANGCPLDSDGDGVPDYIDRCPNTNAGTKVDAYGCPDSLKIPRYDAYGRPIDGDGDGIPDYLDNCPEIPGVESNNGCPEVTEETMSILQTLEGIQFETAKSVIRRSYYEILSKVVKIMKENPHYKLIISGHTDNVGESEMNERLSNSRANEVRRYLINRGVDANRLKAVGYGDKKPIADNSTEIGRKKNRRVQFEIDYVK